VCSEDHTQRFVGVVYVYRQGEGEVPVEVIVTHSEFALRLLTKMSPTSSPTVVDFRSTQQPNISSSYTDRDSSPWILHHILEYKPFYELRLRVMFSFNAGKTLNAPLDHSVRLLTINAKARSHRR
jgi:hypothetical protein